MEMFGYEIYKKLSDYNNSPTKSSLLLLNYESLGKNNAKFPIKWFGKINGEDVEFFQPDYSKEGFGFEYTKFPEKYEHLKKEILKIIDQKLEYI